MTKNSFLICAIFLMASISCGYFTGKGENFYTSKGDIDLRRLPLIKPYVIQDTRTNYWLIDYHFYDKAKPWNDRQRVDKFTIVDSVIIIECSECIYDGEKQKKVFTVIVPKKQIEKTFVNETEFREYLNDNNIQINKMYQPTETYLNWEKGRPLPWLPIDTLYEGH